MKAIQVKQFGDPEVMQLEDVAEPAPGEDQALVRIEAAGVNPVDCYIRAGIYGARPLPFTPGIDGAGVVEKVGSGTTRVKPGDRVFISRSYSGTYAEKALCHELHLHPLPANIEFAAGAAVGVPYATAYAGLIQRAATEVGETVLIHGGSGAVGIAALQLCRLYGFKAYATAGSQEGRKLCLENGAIEVLDHRDPNHCDELVKITGGGVDVIIELLANVNLARDLPALAYGGRVVVIGSRGKIEIDPRDTMRKDSAILGLALMNMEDEDLAVIFDAIRSGLQFGSLAPIVSAQIPLAEAPSAHHRVMESHSLGKIVLIPGR